MNTHPNAITILCYGDSNTYGKRPDGTNLRHPSDVRWTGRLQRLLGDGYHVIEEGLNSRTTNLDDAKKPGRNGRTYLTPCLVSHMPIDLVIMMLGTNDLKMAFNRPATDVAAAIDGLVNDIIAYAKTEQTKVPQIMLVSPILIDDTKPLFKQVYNEMYNEEASGKSKALSAVIESIAKKHACVFVDAGSVASAGDDGIHFDHVSHGNLATLLCELVKSTKLK